MTSTHRIPPVAGPRRDASTPSGPVAPSGPPPLAGEPAGPIGPVDPGPPPRRRRRWRRVVIGVVAVLVLAGASGYWALERYVIEQVQIADVAAYEAAVSGSAGSESASAVATASGAATDATDPAAADAVVTATTYASDAMAITISTVVTGTGSDTVTAYVADVTVADATSLRGGFANNQFGENIIANTSDIAAMYDAVFAVNGDYYGFRDTGIVIRNGVIFRDDGARTGLAMYADGTMAIYDETTTSAEQLLADGVWNTLSFGPALVDGGEIVEGIDEVEVDTNFGNHSIQGEQPRTGIGVIDANHFVFIAVDGRAEGYSKGVTMTQFAQMFQDLGATTAYNLDGGGSTTMWFNGEVVNDPLGKGEERGTSDILYLA